MKDGEHEQGKGQTIRDHIHSGGWWQYPYESSCEVRIAMYAATDRDAEDDLTGALAECIEAMLPDMTLIGSAKGQELREMVYGRGHWSL